MKIRTDFVTNSSSSSFVIALKKHPESFEEFIKLLYGDFAKEDRVQDIDLVKVLYQDIPKKSMSGKRIMTIFQNEDWCYILKNFNDWMNSSYEEIRKFNKENGKEKANEFLRNFQDAFIFQVEYEDCGNNYENRLTNSDFIKELPHFIFSHH